MLHHFPKLGEVLRYTTIHTGFRRSVANCVTKQIAAAKQAPVVRKVDSAIQRKNQIRVNKTNHAIR